jgi:hypothetical protein
MHQWSKSNIGTPADDTRQCPARRRKIGWHGKGRRELERIAQCHCGALKVVTSGEPVQVYLCHCQSCQRRTGSVAHCGSRWLKSQIRIEGDHKIYTRKGDSGFSPRWHFCPNCGSNVFTESDRAPDLCVITVGSFADPNFPAPTASIYEESMHSWFGLSTVSHHFAQGSPRDARGFPINH